MGWPWGSASQTSNEVKNLDPSLREMLDNQNSKPLVPPPKPETPYLDQVTTAPKPSETTTTAADSAPKVPPQSQFQDGRYAKLWENYKPLAQVEDATKTDQQRMRDLMEDQESKKAFLGMMALENCAMEQWAEHECLTGPVSVSRALLCRDENRAFSRCFETQSKLLKALGYMSVINQPEEAEKVQMHADRLWQRIVEQEKAIDEAKKNDQPIPHFQPVLPRKDITPASELSEELGKALEKRVRGMNPQQRAIEEAAFAAEIENQKTIGKQGVEFLEREQQARSKRFKDVLKTALPRKHYQESTTKKALPRQHYQDSTTKTSLQRQFTDTPHTLRLHRFNNMPITNLALADPFAALSITGQPPPNVLFNFNPVHIVHRDPRPIATQGPPSVQQLTLEQLAESTYTINLPLNTSSIRKILQGRRKFISEMEGMINDLPHITELTVVVGIEPIHTDLTNARETVTDLFWTTVNAALFYRNSLIKYTASMENTHYIANNGDEVRALLEDLTFMVV
ncbi:hypothetical protein EG327_011648 [Venturia inaequalis]|uniref:Uncharacterized protein n=1 Tax=Venturia inaequalis TaxID=5025 RepID=A0A8H3UCA0_VENIN|nr:hypothetical protein EG327_011648 [Venturia inaequalis]